MLKILQSLLCNYGSSDVCVNVQVRDCDLGFGCTKEEQSNDVVSMLNSKESGNKKYNICRSARNL